jgi:hypothetical protein
MQQYTYHWHHIRSKHTGSKTFEAVSLLEMLAKLNEWNRISMLVNGSYIYWM